MSTKISRRKFLAAVGVGGAATAVAVASGGEVKPGPADRKSVV